MKGCWFGEHSYCLESWDESCFRARIMVPCRLGHDSYSGRHILTTKKLKFKKTQGYLRSLASFLYKYPLSVLALFLALTVYFGSLALKLEQKTTLRDLLPANDPVVKNFEDTVENFDLIDRVVVVLEFESDNLDLAQTFAELFEEQVQSQEETGEYLHWIKANLFDQSDESDWFQYLQFLTRLLPPEQIPPLIDRLSPEGVAEQVHQNRRELESGLASKNLIEKDPLNLLEFAGSYYQDITGNYQLSFTDGFIVSSDQDMLLILGKPTKSPEDVDFAVSLDTFLRKQIEITKKQLAEEEEINPDEYFTIGLTGPHPIAAHENEVIKGDVVSMFVTSFVFVLLLFVLAYRRPLAILYVGFPLLCAEVWTLGIGYLLFGRLNLLTATFSAIIVGLGIDYAIHIFSRYLDERLHEKSVLASMQYALVQTGMGTVVGGVTTAGAFLAIGVGNFTGVREFAVIAAVGIVSCLVQMFVTLPCMLFIRERMRRKKAGPPRAQWDFHVEKLLNLCLRHKKVSLVVLLGGTVFFIWHAAHLRFTSDIRSVRAKSNPSITLQNKVTAKVGGSLRSLTFVLSADTEEDLYELHNKMAPVLSQMKDEGDLVRFDSLLMVLQGPEAQNNNMESLQLANVVGHSLVENFEKEMAANGFRITPAGRAYIENLAKALEAREPVTLTEIFESQTGFVRPFLNIGDGKFRTLIHVYPSIGLWQKDATRTLTNRILNTVEDNPQSSVFVTGIQTIADELKAKVRETFEISTVIAVGLVFLILYIHFNKLSLIFLTLVPLAISVTWMLGTMHLLGIDITLLNFVATPLIIGIGIDDGVHIVEKYLYRQSEEIGKLIASCGKAVTLTSLTTIFGFSSLFLADYSGFQSLGLCAILGVFFCWLGSVILLPLLMDLTKIKFVRENEVSCDAEDSP